MSVTTGYGQTFTVEYTYPDGETLVSGRWFDYDMARVNANLNTDLQARVLDYDTRAPIDRKPAKS